MQLRLKAHSIVLTVLLLITLGAEARDALSAASNPSNDASPVAAATVSPVTTGRPKIFVANSGNNTVTEYVAPYSGAPTITIRKGVDDPTALAADGVQGLFVANAPSGRAATVTYYQPPYTGTPMTLRGSLGSFTEGPVKLALNADRDLFVLTAHSVFEYVPPYDGMPLRIRAKVSGATGLVLNSEGDLFVSDVVGCVVEFKPPYRGQPITIKKGVSRPSALAVDAAGNLFVANSNSSYGGKDTVTEYAPPYDGTPATTIRRHLLVPHGLALNSKGDLFVLNSWNGPITMFARPYSAEAVTINKGLQEPNEIVISSSDDLFVSNMDVSQYGHDANIVLRYAPPYTGKPTVIKSGVSLPTALITMP